MIAGMPWWLYVALAAWLWGTVALWYSTVEADETPAQQSARMIAALGWPVAVLTDFTQTAWRKFRNRNQRG